MVRGGRKAVGSGLEGQEELLMLLRYDISTDSKVEVTQEWIDGAQQAFNKFGAARGHARAFLESPHANPEGTRKAFQEFLDAWRPEFEGTKVP